MKLEKKLKNYILKLFSEESEALSNRERQLEENVQNLSNAVVGYEAVAENVRNLNAAMEVQKAVAENVRNLNKIVAGYEAVAENVRNLNAAMEVQKAVAENVRNLNATVSGYEAVAENVRNLNATVSGYEAVAENVRNLNATVSGYEAVAENVRNLNATVPGYEAVAENVRNLNEMLHNYKEVVDNLRNNNAVIEMLSSEMEMQKVKLTMLGRLKSELHSSQTIQSQSVANPDESAENVYCGIDYFDFENHFRGSMKSIKENQQQYVKYYKGRNNVIDLGCGRGEFLELLLENGIDAKGVDIYEEFAQMCSMRGLDVIRDDALSFLDAQQKVGGIFAGQLIEHLTVNQLVKLCRLAYEKLEEGAYVIMETPNPTCLAIYSHAFYIDPSHNKPIHPLTIKYILEKAGFTDIEIIYTDTSRLPVCIPSISGIEGADQFNDAMRVVSEILFGSQDYAIIAKKHASELIA